jgi:hypothetical protein
LKKLEIAEAGHVIPSIDIALHKIKATPKPLRNLVDPFA